MKPRVSIGSRFATQKEALSDPFMKINRFLDRINVSYNLPDLTDFNEFRYPWALPYLSQPAFYAARLWEYPFVFYAGEFKPGMRVLDVGCGMNPFTIFLHKETNCHISGADPDLFTKGVKYKCHGVSHEYIKKTGLKIVEAGMEKLPFPNNFFDRVICVSVVEHVEHEIAKKGIQEMARVLKPNGRLIVTLDVNLHSELGRPLDLLWDSNLLPVGPVDLHWPYQRFGNFCDGLQPADVYGLVMNKNPYKLQTKHLQQKEKSVRYAWEIPHLQKLFTQRLERKDRVEQQLSATVSQTQTSKTKESGILRLLKSLFQ